MKRAALLIAFVMMVTVLAPAGVFGASKDKDVSVVFTSDIHSHMDSVHGSGGMARVSTIVKQEKKKNKNSFLLDAGNFSMGTVFQTIYEKKASELKVMGGMGYDAVALGASEFNYGAGGLAKMLRSAASSKKTTKTTTSASDSSSSSGYPQGNQYNRYRNNTSGYGYTQTAYTTQVQTGTAGSRTETTFSKSMPEVVNASINWSKSLSDRSNRKDVRKLQKAWNRYDVNDYTIIKKNGVKMAVFGIMGESAKKAAKGSGVSFRDEKKRVKAIVDEIETNKEADIIVGLVPDNGSSTGSAVEESKELAGDVDGIDLIIAGSGLSGIKEPETKGDTVIVGAAGNTAQVGHVVLSKNGDSYKVKKYDLIDVKDSTKKDPGTNSRVKGFASDVSSDYLRDYGYSYNEKLAKNNVEFTPIEKLSKDSLDDSIGDLISDSYIDAVKDAEGSRYRKVDMAFVSLQNIRAGIEKGNVTSTDAYDINGAGIGTDGTPGYPIVTAYLTGKEVKRIIEADASLAKKDSADRIFVSGAGFSVNSHRMYLNKAFDMRFVSGGKTEKIENGKLYRVVTGLSEIRNLSSLDDVAFGLMKVEPKNRNGKVVKNTDSLVLKKGRKEVKTWEALAGYIGSMKGGKISSQYAGTPDRILDRTGFNPVTFVKDLNYMGIILLAVILIIIVVIIAIALVLRNRRYAKRGFGKRVFKPKKKRYGRGISSRPLGFSRGRRHRRKF